MKTIYLDNSATTPMLPEVIDSVTEAMKSTFGNPSSTHQLGRKSRALVENARKSIAKQLKASSAELFFTAGGSEADNLILHNAVTNLAVKTIISSKIEHHAIIHTIEHLRQKYAVEVKWVNLKSNGAIDYQNLEQLLENTSSKTLVSLMYVNNEIGNLLDLEKVSDLCTKYEALFHSDTVQGIGHFDIDVTKIPIDFFTASAHKFHGPKGVGFAYIKKGFGVQPILFGGEQEKGARAGTENIHSIFGMQKALEIACNNLAEESAYIQSIKNHFINSLKSNFKDIKFNGLSESEAESSYIILNVRFPKSYPMLLFNLDLKGIAASGGSACQSGSSKGSHVLYEILDDEEALKTSVRFSFSKFTTIADIDYVISVLKELIQ
ncbi:MAG: cysteine desulfurase family protein [Lutibacter sp.]|uniref:cysteine desulfurase family protein n=1 Tax=Lutibacter sp. TaxID=1925666 RepID=UPI00299CF5AB|nr:cysteine desulfurase family protein [Lutibacter sp.]MDX1828285.1 cysteine desulfurase family protein [Lutibacter sp.]